MFDPNDVLSWSPSERQELLERLRAAPHTRISGTITHSLAPVRRWQVPAYWYTVLTMTDWGPSDSQIRHTTQFKVLIISSERTCAEYEENISTDRVIFTTTRDVQLVEEFPGRGHWGLVDETAWVDAENKFSWFDWFRPIQVLPDGTKFHRDRQFGKFDREPGGYWFEGAARWHGKFRPLRLDVNQPRELKKAIKIARTLWANQAEWVRRIEEFSLQELRTLKNGGWLEEGEAEISPEDFLKRLTFQSAEIRPDGSFTFLYDADEMFTDHDIEICGSLADGLTSADIVG